MKYLRLVYSSEGRLNRLRFFKYQVLFMLFSALVAFVLAFFGALISGSSESALITIPTEIWSFVASIGSIMINVRRLHDLNHTGWFVLIPIFAIFIVPIGLIIVLIFWLYLFFAPGTVGYNRYGADPLAY